MIKRALRIGCNTEYSENSETSVEVRWGESFLADAELCSGPWLRDGNSEWAREKELPGNILTCIGLPEASRGDTLKVNILALEPERFAYTGLEGKGGFEYPESFLGGDYKEPQVQVVEAGREGLFWNGTRFPTRPMLGCMGTARPKGGREKEFPDACGGNLDVREIAAGCAVYLPVRTERALLFIGDMHAAQGDGEITGWGAECRGTAKLRIEKAPSFPFETEDAVLMEDKSCIIAAGFGKGFENAYNASIKALLEFATLRSGRGRNETYIRMGLAMRSHVAQSCFPEQPVFVAKFPKEYL